MVMHPPGRSLKADKLNVTEAAILSVLPLPQYQVSPYEPEVLPNQQSVSMQTFSIPQQGETRQENESSYSD